MNKYVREPHKCPVCGEYEFYDVGCHDICPVCNWEDDIAQICDPDEERCANTLSLNQYRADWPKQQAKKPII